MIKVRDLEFEYFDRDEENNLTDMINAIGGINFDAKKGEFIGVAGRNGSGKSTFAKILNRLLVSVEGSVTIAGLDAGDAKNIIDIRRIVGMVFQNPDDQLVGSIVAEDVAFGAENLGVPQNKLWDRVYEALRLVGIPESEQEEFAKKRINQLSGGEKQKVAIASVLAMKTDCIVLDEATSMLDAESKSEILDILKRLNKEQGITIILITHMMEELLLCDTIYIFDRGYLVKKGRPETIFSDGDELVKYGLELPQIVKIAKTLQKDGIIQHGFISSVEQLVKYIFHQYSHKFSGEMKPLPDIKKAKIKPHSAVLIDKVSFGYSKGQNVINDVSLAVSKGEYVLLLGPSGAGKSTLLQLIPGLLKPTRGACYVDGEDVFGSKGVRGQVRRKIGYLFQYPEQQLFAENAYEDVVYGPRNLGVSEIEAEKRAYEAIELVGLPQDIYDIPISKLSGGQKRRLALAGIIAIQPEYLILDEPFAGLDPEGKKEMQKIISALNKEAKITIIMISHDIDAITEDVDRICLVENGRITLEGEPAQFYCGLDEKNYLTYVPVINKVVMSLAARGLPVDWNVKNLEDGIKSIEEVLSC